MQSLIGEELDRDMFQAAYEAMECSHKERRAQYLTRIAGCALRILEAESRA